MKTFIAVINNGKSHEIDARPFLESIEGRVFDLGKENPKDYEVRSHIIETCDLTKEQQKELDSTLCIWEMCDFTESWNNTDSDDTENDTLDVDNTFIGYILTK